MKIKIDLSPYESRLVKEALTEKLKSATPGQALYCQWVIDQINERQRPFPHCAPQLDKAQ